MNLRTATLAASLCLAAPACMSSTEPLDPVIWEADLSLTSEATDVLTGRVLMVANPHNTEIGVYLSGTPGAGYSWHVRSGTCAGSGTAVGPDFVFPAVTINDEGEGTGLATLNRRVDRGTYAGVVVAGADGSGPVVACADLVETG